MAAINLTEVDFDQIKYNLVDYLKSTEQFTDYDFDGSNLQVILNLIAYQAQLNAYSTNMIANESFLSSATLRNNVVANARQVGYTPNSVRSANTAVTFQYSLSSGDYPSGLPKYLQIQPGPIFSTANGDSSVTFNILDVQTSAVTSDGTCLFNEVVAYEGFYLSAEFTVDESTHNQKFILDNVNIDTTTIRVEVQEDPNQTTNEFYSEAKNLATLTPLSRIYWLEEVEDGRYELTFGDDLFGKKLQNGAKVFVNYLVSSGVGGNGITGNSNYSFIGRTTIPGGAVITERPTVLVSEASSGGADLEGVSSIKFRAPREYATQSRCVISEDYETMVRRVYPGVDDVYVFGGEVLDIPQYGRVFVIIKSNNGSSLSGITKNFIKESLNEFRIASLDVVIMDAEVLNVEVVTTVFYDNKRTIKDSSAIVATVKETLTNYSDSSTVSKFGGAVRYSRTLAAIDDSDVAITRNNTTLRMRRDLPALLNTAASYEICFENPLKNNNNTTSVFSTGFYLRINGIADGQVYFFEDDTLGNVYRFYFNDLNEKIIVDKTFGTVDYTKGEIKIGYTTPITIVNTTVADSIIEVRAIPQNQDVIASRTVYANFDVSKSDINAVVDTEIAGS